MSDRRPGASARIATAEARCGRYLLSMEWPVPAGSTDALSDLHSVVIRQFFDFVGDDFDSDGQPMEVSVGFEEVTL